MEPVHTAPRHRRGTGPSPRIVIIGAGPTGLGAGYRLRELGFETCAHHGYRNAVTFVSRKPANPANI